MKSKVPVVVDFWAPWCGPCRMVSPTIEKYGIMSIPTVVFFKNGQIVNTLVGAQSKDVYKTSIENLLK